MRRATRFIVRFGYYYSLALGFVHCRYHFGSGSVRASTALSLYSLAVSLLLVAILPLQFQHNVSDDTASKARYFYQLLYVAMTALRTTGVTLTLLVNWLRRHEITRIVADFQRLHRQHFARLQPQPATQRRFERGLVRKFLLTALSDTARWALSLRGANSSDLWRICALGIVINALNMVVSVLYFASQCLVWHYELLNDELLRVLRAINATSHLRRWHERTFRRHYAQLADELDQLLAIRHELRALARRINAVSNVQSVCIMLHLYISNLSAIYIIYSLQKPNALVETGMTAGGAVFSLLSALLYYVDLREFIATNLHLLQVSQAGVRLLRQQLQLEFLDARLKRGVEQFYLQDACDPLEISLLGLFNFNGASVFANFGSTFAHSIIIIQYDFKNF